MKAMVFGVLFFMVSCTAQNPDRSAPSPSRAPVETLDTFMARQTVELTVRHRPNLDRTQYTADVPLAEGTLTLNFYLAAEGDLDGARITFDLRGMRDFVAFKAGRLGPVDRISAMHVLKYGGERTICDNQVVETIVDATFNGHTLAAKASLGVYAAANSSSVHTQDYWDDFFVEDGCTYDSTGFCPADCWSCSGGGGGGGDTTCTPTHGDATAGCVVSGTETTCNDGAFCQYYTQARYPDGTTYCQSNWSRCVATLISCYCQ